jgi:selT/selW/selH-like putative selenoprotein
VKLTKGGRGIFEIRQNGQVLYSKASTGHFPTPAELAKLNFT